MPKLRLLSLGLNTECQVIFGRHKQKIPTTGYFSGDYNILLLKVNWLIMKIISLIITLCSMAVLPGVAQKSGTIQLNPEIQTLKTIAYLTRYGHAHQDAASFLQAARMLGKQPIQIIGIDQVTVSPATDATMTTHAQHRPFFLNADTLLAEGRRLAGTDTILLALANQVAWELDFRARGRTDGPKTMAAQVKGGSSFAATWSFKGGKVATISVVGDGDNDLDLFVFDKRNKVVAQDDSHIDACEVHFTPSKKADYKIVVKNWGNSYSDFVLITN